MDFDANVRLKGEVQLSCFDSRIMQVSLNYIFQEMKGNFFFQCFLFLSSQNNKPNEKIKKRNWKSGKDDQYCS